MAISKVTTSNTNTINKVVVTDGDAISVITVGTQGLAGAATLLGRTTEAETVGSSDSGSTVIYDHANARWLATTSSDATSLNTKLAGLVFTAGGATVTGILDEDNLGSDSNTKLATQQSIKAYVDAQITAQDFDFQGDTGGALNIDLDSETMTFTGGTGIDTTGSGNTVTFAIDSTVATLSGSQTLSNKTLTAPVLNTVDINGGDISSGTTINKSPSITLAGDLSGSVTLSNLANGTLTATIVANSVALGTDTTGNYVSSLVAGTGVTLTNNSGETATPTIAIGQSVGTTDDVTFNSVTADVTGDLTGNVIGATEFTAKAGEDLTKGDAVYISGISGNTPVVNKADADDASKMPSFGLAESTVSANGTVGVITFGTLTGLDTSSFSAGDILFISTTAGSLTDTQPSGESSQVQNIGIVQRAHATVGAIKVGGAGRTNATPNLNDGKIFIGNGSNAVITSTLDTSLVPENTNLYHTTERVQDIVGAMVTSNTESGIAVTYEDSDGTLDFDVADFDITLTGDVTGSGTVTNLGNVSFAATIQANSVALGTDTTGNYLATLAAANSGIDVANSGSESAAVTVGLNTEYVQDIVGAMFSSNTETGIAVSYEDSDGTIDLVIGSGVITNDMLAGSIANGKLANSTITVTDGSTSTATSLGGTITFAAGEGLDVGESSGTVTYTAEIATETNAGVATFDGTDFTVTSGDVTLNAERVQDIVGAMVGSNTESGIAVTYEDGDGTLDFNVNDPTITIDGDVDGSATMTNLGNTTITTTLDTVNSNVGSFGSATAIPAITVNAKGLVTAVTTNNIATNFTLAADSGSNDTFNTGETLTFTGTSNEITTTVSNNAITFALPDDVTIGNDLTVTGDLTVNGDTVTLNTATLDVEDATIRVAKGATSLANTNGAGIEFGASSSKPTITWDNGNSRLTSNKTFHAASLIGALTGNASTATTLETARTIHGVSFDGSANIDLSEVISDTVGAMFSSNTETGITATYQDADNTIDLVVGTLNQDTTGNAATATALETARTIGGTSFDGTANIAVALAATATALANARTIHGVSFDGTANIDLTEVVQDTVGAMFSSNTETNITATYEDSDGTIDLVIGTLNQDTTGNSATATALETARTIHGVSFDGTANIDLSEVIQDTVGGMFSSNTETNITVTYEDSDGTIDLVIGTLNQDTTGNAATATALETARTIHGVSFDGTANIDLSEVISDTVGAMFSSNTETGITVTYDDSDNTIDLVVGTLNQDTTGNAATATALETARTIHGVSFDGSANIDLSEVISDTVGAMFSSNTETGVTVTYQDADNTIDVVVDTSALTETLTNKTLTSPVLNTGVSGTAIKDEDNMASDSATHLATQQSIKAYVDATAQTTEEVQDIVGAMFSSNTETGITVTYEDGDGTIDLVVGTLNQDTTGTAALATTVTVTANNSTDEDIFPVFVDGATGTQGLETDTGLTYNPSTGLLTATGFSGNLTGTLQTAAQANVTSVGTLTSLAITGDLTVDTNVLKVDTSNNRIGIKQASPTVTLDIGSATDAILLPVGTTAQRPTGAAGQFRYNSTLGKFEGYTDEWGEIGGGAGASTFNVNTFTADGSTTAFTLSQAPASEDNILVFVEGVFMNANDFVLSGTTLTLDEAPPNGRKITVYHVSAAVAGTGLTQDSFTGNGSTTAFTLSVAPVSENNTQVYIDGVYQNKATYSTSGTTLTFDAAPANSAAIEAITFTQTNINTFPASGISDLSQVTPVAGDFMMILDATDSALKKSDVKDVMRTAVAIDSNADAVALTFNADEDATFAGNIKTTGTKKIEFGDTGTFIHQSADGVLDLVSDNEIEINATTIDVNGALDVSGNITGTLATAAQTNITSLGTLTALTVDDITIDGSTISDGGDLTLDAEGDIILDANGTQIILKDNGTEFAQFLTSSTPDHLYIRSMIQDKDIILSGNDNGSFISALTLDMSDAGKATFNNGIRLSADTQLDFGDDNRILKYTSDNIMTLQSAAHVVINIDNNANTSDAYFSIKKDTTNPASGGTELFKVQENGNVGIGTTDPDGPLHVKPASGDTYVILEAGQSDGNAGLIYHNNSGTQVGYNLYDTDDNIYYIGVGGINRLKVQSGGHFELRGPDANSNQVRMMDSSGNIDGYLYAEAGEIGFLDADGNWAFQVNTDTSLQGKINNSEAFLFKIAAGNHNNHEIMSIGGVTPRNDITLTQQAHGENWGSGGHTTNGYFYVINSSNAGVYIVNGQNGWTSNSDERIKENITSLGTVLPEIANIRCVKFNLKGESETRVGFIAQDWESKSFSEVLNENDGFVVEEDGSVKPATESDSTEKVKGIAYTETVPVLLKAIQEQQTIIDDLKARIEKLES